MRAQHRSDRSTTEEVSSPDNAPNPDAVRSENLFLRNYDPYSAYDVALTVRDEDEETVFEARYHFRPGQIQSVRGVLDSGEYEVTVVLDRDRRKTTTCRVGPDPEHTIHVEIGNGLASLTEGLYG